MYTFLVIFPTFPFIHIEISFFPFHLHFPIQLFFFLEVHYHLPFFLHAKVAPSFPFSSIPPNIFSFSFSLLYVLITFYYILRFLEPLAAPSPLPHLLLIR